MKDAFTQPSLQILTKHVITPTEAEIERNRRSRSAKLRVAQKLENPPIGRLIPKSNWEHVE